MDLSLLPVSGLFFAQFSQRSKKKPAIDTDAGFPVFSHPSSRPGFLCSDNDLKTSPCLHAVQHEEDKRKPAGLVAAGLNPTLGDGGDNFHTRLNMQR
jgi:hypothetical protein